MKLVPEAKQASRLWSIRLAFLAAILAAAEATVPLWHGIIADGVLAAISSAVAIAAAVARVIKQELPHD